MAVEPKERKTRKVSPYKKVRREGGTTAITVGNLIPDHFKMVEVVLVEHAQATDEKPESVTIRYERLG